MKNKACAAVAATLLAGSASAGVINVNFVEVGGDVVINYEGTFDTTGLTPLGVAPIGSLLTPSTGSFVSGATFFTVYEGAFAAPFGTSDNTIFGGFSTGDPFLLGAGVIGVDAGGFSTAPYVSGELLSGTLTLANSTFASLDIATTATPQQFTDGNNTVFTNAGFAQISTVPLPASIVLLLSGIAGLGFVSRKRAA